MFRKKLPFWGGNISILLDLILVPLGFVIVMVTFLTLKLKYHDRNIVKGKGPLNFSSSGCESVKAIRNRASCCF
jgi:hypothetical protein